MSSSVPTRASEKETHESSDTRSNALLHSISSLKPKASSVVYKSSSPSSPSPSSSSQLPLHSEPGSTSVPSSPLATSRPTGKQKECLAHRLQLVESAQSQNKMATLPKINAHERAMTHHLIEGMPFSTPSNYVNVQLIARGAYGLVCTAENLHTNPRSLVAIKCISNPFAHPIMVKRVYRELLFLVYLDHPNILSIMDAYVSQSNDVYFVSKCFNVSLDRVLHAKQLEPNYIQYFMFQLCQGLNHLHSLRLIHRDVKPSNVLISTDCHLVLCDFGLARAHSPLMTGSVTTLAYRAPETMFHWQHYTPSMDMWAVGCIFAEMLLEGVVLFPAVDCKEHLDMMIALLGFPSRELVDSITSPNTKKYVELLSDVSGLPLEMVFKHTDPVALDLLSRLLVMDPKVRLTAHQALQHPYFKACRDRDDSDSVKPVAATASLEGTKVLQTLLANCESLSADKLREQIEYALRPFEK